VNKNLLIFSIAYTPFIGGAEVAIIEITRRIKDVHFTVITPWNDKSLPREEVIEGVKVIRVGVGHSTIDKYILPITGMLKARHLHTKNPFDGVWSMMANTAGLAALFFKWVCKMPYLLTLQEGGTEKYYWKKTWMWRPLYIAIYRQPKLMQVISTFLEDRARRYGYKGDVTLVPNGVDVTRFLVDVPAEKTSSLRTQLELSAEDRVIITTSRIVQKNAIDDLVNGFALLKKRLDMPLKLVVLGDGDQRPMVEKIINQHGLNDDVLLLGFVDHAELPTYLAMSDVFIRPSRSEGLGNSFLEAMGAGLPIVGTPVGGIRDFLVDGETGVFCQPDDPESIAVAIERLLTNEKLRSHVIEKGRAMVPETYNWDVIAKTMRGIFDRLWS